MCNFDGHFIAWRKTRINKLVSILGEGWFQGKTVLELGCGYGHIGKEIQQKGSLVTFVEGRKEYIEKIKENVGNSEIILLDQENEWNLERVFDLVIHWGVLYHLENWKKDLIISLRHGKIITLESEVVDSNDPNLEIKVTETGWGGNGALHAVGTRPSVAAIEKCILDQNLIFKRYDDPDLNAEYHFYDWKGGTIAPNNWKSGMRRFWIIRKN